MTTHNEQPVRTQTPAGLFLRATIHALGAALLLAASGSFALDSTSTGADGAFAPSVNTRLALSEDGIFNFTTVDIPAGVLVTFEKNTTNTPVTILASGDVNIAGTISVSGGYGTDAGAAGDGNLGDDGIPGKGGPGGYDGGIGGPPEGDHLGGSGLGPGGGGYGYLNGTTRGHGGGGSFGSRASVGSGGSKSRSGSPGSTYGSSLLLPFIGGSGGGGGMGGDSFAGSGGGGGGGALLIASSGTLSVTGAIHANGGGAGKSAGGNCGAAGGGGSGGAIRLLASKISGNGEITATGGARRPSFSCTTHGYYVATDNSNQQSGGDGRIRLEAQTLTRTAATSPAMSAGLPGDLFVAGLPTLRIASVAGAAAPEHPSGVADIELPADVPNPVTVELEARGIPLGNIVEIKLTPTRGPSVSSVSNALDGTVELSAATALIDLPQGPSTLMATVTYTLVAAIKEDLEQLAGEPVESIRVEASTSGQTRYVLITECGRELRISAAQLASAG